MSKPPEIGFTTDANEHLVAVTLKGTATSLEELVKLVPELRTPEGLDVYCDALNHFKYGTQYHVIHDPEAFRQKYERKLAAEKPGENFQAGAVRVSDFGVCDTSEIERPEVVGETVVFFAEDDFLGLPYRVVGPAPGEQVGEVSYEPLQAPAED